MSSINMSSILSIILLSTMLLSYEQSVVHIDTETSISFNGKEYFLTEQKNHENYKEFREEIILWEEDFESGAEGWSIGAGWQMISDDFNSSSHSMNSINDASTLNGSWNLFSPTLSLAELGDGETMNFSFFLKSDMPDVDGDDDDYLDDYYAISIMDIDALAWHTSNTGSFDGNSYWCGDEDIGGYLDSWVQFLDTPPFTVPSSGELSADMMWSIESPMGAENSGSCTDGWDAANVRISIDGGVTWDLLIASGLGNGYDFDCGYGWIWNDAEYDTGGSLNHLASGWGGNQEWTNISFDLSAYAGHEAIVRFAFSSDPAYSTIDDSSLTGLHVDNISIPGILDCTPENDCDISISGAVWVDQFYDYCDVDRPGYQMWEEYVSGMPFNGNVFMDISDFAGKDITFRVQSRYDDNDDGGSGNGLYIDDIKIYKISGGNHPPPIDLIAVPGNNSASLSWYDMNASGTGDIIYHNSDFANGDSINLTSDGTAWVGERFDFFGLSTVNSINIFSINSGPVDVSIGGFAQLGTLYNSDAMYSMNVTLQPGENTFDVSWDMNNAFIIGYTFSDVIIAGLDSSPTSNNSMISLGGGWDPWSEYETDISPGEWGVSANITYTGAGVTYNIYRDGTSIESSIIVSTYTDTDLTNNTTYEYTLSATYSDGEESGESNSVMVTPFANTVHEEGYDDGTFEADFNTGSGNFSAVRFTAGTGENIVRFKWFQNGSSGAFYIKVFADENCLPGSEIFSMVQASGNSDGWNDIDLSSQGLAISGDFWIGTKEFSSSKPFGLDTDSNAGNSYQRAGSSGVWTQISGNLAYHVYLDCIDCSSPFCGDNLCSCDENDGSCPEDCTGCTSALGDMNADGIWNVQDIVLLVDCVLNDNCGGIENACAGDINGDEGWSVLDIILLANCVINDDCSGRVDDATKSRLILGDSQLTIESDGFIGGVQMTLSHGDDFTFELTDLALVSDYRNSGNTTRLLIITPETGELFKYIGDFDIIEIIVANSHIEVPVEITEIANISLSTAYPNPFNPITTMELFMPESGNIQVEVYNLLGQSVATLISGYREIGKYKLQWDATEATSGMYFVKAQAAGFIKIQKIILIK